MPINTRVCGAGGESSVADPAVTSLKSVFVKLDKSADWLIKIVGGIQAQRGSLSRTTIIEEIRTKVKSEVQQSDVAHHTPAVADVADDDDDPMATLEAVTSVGGDNRRPKRQKVPPRQIVEFDMPMYEPMKHPDSTEKRSIRCLAINYQSVYLSLNDIPWLVTWLYDAVACGAVPLAPVDPLTANCPKVPGARFTWDFADSWEAVILSGPLAGTKIITKLSDFTHEKWAIVDVIYKYGITYAESTDDQKKAAALNFLERHVSITMAAARSNDGIPPQ